MLGRQCKLETDCKKRTDKTNTMCIELDSKIIHYGLDILKVGIGSFMGAFFAFRLYKRQVSERTTIDLFNEFQTRDFIKARTRATKILNDRKAKEGYVFDLYELKKELSEDEWFDLSHTLHFLEKYAIYHCSNYLREDLANKTLGRYFEHWYQHFKPYMEHSFEKKSNFMNLFLSIKKLSDKLNLK